MGNFEAVHGDNSVNLKSAVDSNERTHDIPVDGTVYDNEQVLYLIRCLPLKVGYTAEFDIFPVQSGTVSHCRIDVTGTETVPWQGGEMDCYAIKLAVFAAGVFVVINPCCP